MCTALGFRLVFAALTAGTYDPDEFVILTLSRDFAHGAIPYHDFVFFHPPGALVLFGGVQPLVDWWWPSARLVTLLIDTGTAGLVCVVGNHLYDRRTGLFAGLLYAASPLALVCSGRVGQDPIATFLGIAGLTVLLRARGRAGAILAGSCLGAAIWFKYPALVFAPVYLLAARHRAILLLSSMVLCAALLFVPFAAQGHAMYQETVLWQSFHRVPTPLWQRVIAVSVYLLLIHPIAVIAMKRSQQPAWLRLGFGAGLLFVLAPQVYYHYFVPMVPFAALLAAPVVAGMHQVTVKNALAVATLVTLVWATIFSKGNDAGRLFITALKFADIHNTVQALAKDTRPGEAVLTDQMEYTYLAHRPALGDYFWNMSEVVTATALEHQLKNAGAVVLTLNVASTYPAGLVPYLVRRHYLRLHENVASVWIVPAGATAQVVNDKHRESYACTAILASGIVDTRSPVLGVSARDAGGRSSRIRACDPRIMSPLRCVRTHSHTFNKRRIHAINSSVKFAIVHHYSPSFAPFCSGFAAKRSTGCNSI